MTGNIAAGIGLAIIAALCLNYFFTEPRFSFRINAAEDVVEVTAFAMTGIVIVNLVARARRLGEATALRDQLQLTIDTIPAMVWSNLPGGSRDFLKNGSVTTPACSWGKSAVRPGWMQCIRMTRPKSIGLPRSRRENLMKRRRGCAPQTANTAAFYCVSSHCATEGAASSNGMGKVPTSRI